jgi:pimeloyl-ACP methyl ester carboxylesterase
VTSAAYARYQAFKKTQPRTPRLTRTTVKARGIPFAVFTSPAVGDAPPLVCINGGMIYSHALLWPALAPLAQDRQLILYDQRGRGATPAAPGARTSRVEYDAGDVVALREALGIARWDVLGHSWGGGIAMLAAARDPVGVRRLVLIDSVGATSDWVANLHPDAVARLDGAARETLAALDPVMLHAVEPAIHTEYSRAIYPAYFHDRELARLFSPPVASSETGSAVIASQRRDGYDWRDAVRTIQASTLVLHGLDDVLPARLAQETAALIPNAELALIADAGHMPFWEQPEATFDAVRAFLARADRGR